jgi:hypothetical protein
MPSASQMRQPPQSLDWRLFHRLHCHKNFFISPPVVPEKTPKIFHLYIAHIETHHYFLPTIIHSLPLD